VSTTPVESRGTVVEPPGAPVSAPGPVVRRARVGVTRIDPWSVMKLGFLLSLALGVVLLVATAMVWWVLDSAEVFSTISTQILDVTGDGTSFRLEEWLGFGRVMRFAATVALIDIVLVTALATLTAFLFNLATSMAGPVQVTLTESP